MLKYVATPFLACAVVVAGPTAARAEPITLTSVLIGWLLGSTISAGFEAATGHANPWHLATGKPNIREMKRQLDALADRDRAHAAEIAWLRSALQERMTRAEVEQLLMRSLSRVDKALAEHARRLKKLENEALELRAENRYLRQRVGRLEGRTATHARQIGTIETRVDVHERWIQDHERRIRELERKVAVLGALGFTRYRQGRYAEAVQQFEQAIENDPGDPGYHYGKALALKRLGRSEEAVRAIRTGSAAERVRRPGQWYRTVMERVQGPDRAWLQRVRVNYQPVVVRP